PELRDVRERLLERLDGHHDLRLLALVEHAGDHPPQLDLRRVEVLPLTLHPDLANDAPSEELAQRHADRAARDLEREAQILGAERLGRKIQDGPDAAHVALEAPELD